jgi:Domain of unknown function (DUF222)
MPTDTNTVSLDRLESEIGELAAHLSAATCRWLTLVGEFDAREGWWNTGCKTCAEWLSWRCALSPAAARDHVRVARCLRELPVIRETFGRGELSFSQVRALTRIATPEVEEDLVRVARHTTAAQLEVVVRAYRGVLDRELGGSQPEHRRRFVQCRHDIDGALLITARLPAEEGALVMAALDAGRDAVRDSARASAETTQTGDSADALVLMADTMLASGPPTGRAASDTRWWCTSTPRPSPTTTSKRPASWRTAPPCTPRPRAGWAATPRSSASSNATGARSRSAAGRAACRRR